MITIGELTIHYNAQARAWQIEGLADTPSFSTGAIGRNQAIQYAIKQAFPEVAAAVERLVYKHGRAVNRAWPAAHLLVAGHVLAPVDATDPYHLAAVLSQQGPTTKAPYHIVRVDNQLTCSCRDFERGGVVVRGHLCCKHILAFRLGQYLSWPLLSQPSAPEGPRRTAGGQWRGRLVTRVNGRHHSPSKQQGTTPGSTPLYTNGQPVGDTHHAAYHSFTSVTGMSPANEEKLLSWYYGR